MSRGQSHLLDWTSGTTVVTSSVVAERTLNPLDGQVQHGGARHLVQAAVGEGGAVAGAGRADHLRISVTLLDLEIPRNNSV